jgi:hypothetical protein
LIALGDTIMQNWMTQDSFSRRCREETDRHYHAIDKLVSDLGVPTEEVTRYYFAILEVLKKDITVRAFLPLLASIRVKKQLLRRRSADISVPPLCLVD